MARRITEEKLTLTIIDWLENQKWSIISFDFPQSGTGMLIHPDERTQSSKNLKGFIPDIIACKESTMVIFENKNRFVKADYEKVDYLKNTTEYSNAILQLLSDYDCNQIYYGIGIPLTKGNRSKDKANSHLIDFTIMVSQNFVIEIVYDPNSIFIDKIKS